MNSINGVPFRVFNRHEVEKVIEKYKHFKSEKLGLTIHNNGNVSSSANEDISWATSQFPEVSWHYSIDDKEIVSFIPEGYSCWAAGDGINGYGNSKTINIEICEFNGFENLSDPRWINARSNAVKFIAFLLHSKMWGINEVGLHFDRSGKNCPRVILKEGLEQFKEDILKEKARLEETTIPFVDLTGKYIQITKETKAYNSVFTSGSPSTDLKVGEIYWVKKTYNKYARIGYALAFVNDNGEKGDYLPNAWVIEFDAFRIIDKPTIVDDEEIENTNSEVLGEIIEEYEKIEDDMEEDEKQKAFNLYKKIKEIFETNQ